PRFRGRCPFACTQGAPCAEEDACPPLGGHLLAEQRVKLESLRGCPSSRERRSELEDRQRLDFGLEQRFDRPLRLCRGAAAEHLRESSADLREILAGEWAGECARMSAAPASS